MFRNLTPTVKNLLLANIGVFVVFSMLLTGLSSSLALYNILSPDFRVYQFVTYMFMHADGWHLFSNMFGLFVFGPLLEQFLGAKRFLILWMLSGVLAGVLYGGYKFFNSYQAQNQYESYIENPTSSEFSGIVYDFLDKNAAIMNDPRNEGFKENLLQIREGLSENPTDEKLIAISKEYVREMTASKVKDANTPMVGGIRCFSLSGYRDLSAFFIPFPIKAKYFVLSMLVMSFTQSSSG